MATEYPCAVLRCWRLRVGENTSILEGSNSENGGTHSCAVPSSEGERTWNDGHDRKNNSDFSSCRNPGEAPFSECTDGDTRRMGNDCEPSSGVCTVGSLSKSTPSNDDDVSSSKVECRNSIMSVGRSENNGPKGENVVMQRKAASAHEVDHDKFVESKCIMELRKEKQVGVFRDDCIIVTLVEMEDLAVNPKAYLWIGERVNESTTALATHPSTVDELFRRIAQRCNSQAHQDLPLEITIVHQSQEPQDMLRAFNDCKVGWGILFISEIVSTSAYRVIELVEKQGVAVACERVLKGRLDVISKGRNRTSSQILIPSKMKSYVVVQGSRPMYVWHSSDESASVECLGRHICDKAAFLLHRQNDVPSSSKEKRSKKKSRRKNPSPELFHFREGDDSSPSNHPPKFFWEALGLEEEGTFPVDTSCLPTTLSARDCTDAASEGICHDIRTEESSHGRTSIHQPFQGSTGNDEDPQGRHHFLLDVVKHPCILDMSKAFSPNVHKIKEAEHYDTVVNGGLGAPSFESGSQIWNAIGEVPFQQPSVNTVTEPEHEIGKVISQDSVDNDVGIMIEEEQQRTQNIEDKSSVTTLANASQGQVESTINRKMQNDDVDRHEATVTVHNTPSITSKKSSPMKNKTNVNVYSNDCHIVEETLDPTSNSPEVPKMPRRGSHSSVERARALADSDRFRRGEERVLNANGFMDQVQNLVASIIHDGGKEEREGCTTANQSRQTFSRRGSATDETSILDIRSDNSPVKSTTTLSRRSSAAVYHSPAPITPNAIGLNCGDIKKPTIWETWNPGRSDLKTPLPAMVPEVSVSFETFLDWHKISCAQGFG